MGQDAHADETGRHDAGERCAVHASEATDCAWLPQRVANREAHELTHQIGIRRFAPSWRGLRRPTRRRTNHDDRRGHRERSAPFLRRAPTHRGRRRSNQPKRRSRPTPRAWTFDPKRSFVPDRWSVVRWPTQSLDVGAPLLRFQAPLLGTATRTRRSSRRRRRTQSVGHDGGEPSARSIPVAQLRAVLGCRDRQYSVDDATAQALEESFSLGRREGGRVGHIPNEFRSGVGSVDTLPAGTG